MQPLEPSERTICKKGMKFHGIHSVDPIAESELNQNASPLDDLIPIAISYNFIKIDVSIKQCISPYL